MIDTVVLCASLIIFGIMMYVIFDGFDLGVGIIFPWAPTESCKNKMMSSLAPVWDGNETWLIYGTGILFAAFPKAYALIIPSLYSPIMVMVMALIFRGLAFEFRLKAKRSRWIWNYSFIIGSYLATFTQGVIIGMIIEGTDCCYFADYGFKFIKLDAFTVLTGLSMIAAYAMIGTSWTVMKTDGITKKWAISILKPILGLAIASMIFIAVQISTRHHFILNRWVSTPGYIAIIVISTITIFLVGLTFWGLHIQNDFIPFLSAIGMFLVGFMGLITSIWPYIIIPGITIWDVSAPPETLKFISVVVMLSMPIVLAYLTFVYFLFHGKVTEKDNLYK